MSERNIKTREGYDVWDKLCAIPTYGFIHSSDNSRILKAEGLGNWIDQHAAQEVVDQAQVELNLLRTERDQLQAELAALRATHPAPASAGGVEAWLQRPDPQDEAEVLSFYPLEPFEIEAGWTEKPLYLHPNATVPAGSRVVPVELLDGLLTVIDSNGYAADEVEIVDELRALLEVKP